MRSHINSLYNLTFHKCDAVVHNYGHPGFTIFNLHALEFINVLTAFVPKAADNFGIGFSMYHRNRKCPGLLNERCRKVILVAT